MRDKLLTWVGCGLLAAACYWGVVPAWALTGDLNRNGIVDFDDFFLFADNFGKSGEPDDVDTVVVLQVDTLVQADTLVQVVRDTVRLTVSINGLAQVAFADSAELDDWGKLNDGTWRLEDGQLVLQAPPVGETVCFFPQSFSGELEIAVDALGLGGAGAYGLLLEESGSLGRRYFVALDGDGGYGIFADVDAGAEVLVDWTTAAPVRQGELNTLNLVLDGQGLALSINGVAVGGLDGLGFFQGRVGMVVNDGREAAFDNLAVDRPQQLSEIERVVRDTVEVVRFDTLEVERVVRDTVRIETQVPVEVVRVVRDTIGVDTLVVTVRDTVTLTATDTLTVTDTVEVVQHDTIGVDTLVVTVVDTVTLTDTLTVTDTVEVVQHDTIGVDTLVVTVVDTVLQTDTLVVTQTDTLEVTQTDTVTLTDTLTVTDTVEVVQHDTIGVDTLVVTVVDTVLQTDTLVVTQTDTLEVTQTDTVVVVQTDTFVIDTLVVTVVDTLVQTDTVTVIQVDTLDQSFEIGFTLITVRLNTLFNAWGAAADGGNLTDPLALDLLGFIVPQVDTLVVQTNALVPPAGDQDAADLLDTFKNLVGLHQQFFTLLQESISEQDVDKFAQALAARDAINQIDQDIFGGITVGLSLPPDRGGGFQ